MWPFLGGIASGLGSLVSGFFSSNQSAQNTQAQLQAQQQMLGQSMEFTNQQNANQMQFQERMSGTAFQRARTDMLNAGLNPMMMFGSGGAASSPSGSSGSVGTPSVPMPQTTSPLAGVGNALSTAVSTAGSLQAINNEIQREKNLKAEEDRIVSATHKQDAEVLKTRADTINSQKTAGVIDEEVAKRAAEKVIRQNEAMTAKHQMGIDAGVRKAGDVASWGMNKAQQATDLIGTGLASALRARQFNPRRSTIERSDNRGNSSFEERFNY